MNLCMQIFLTSSPVRAYLRRFLRKMMRGKHSLSLWGPVEGRGAYRQQSQPTSMCCINNIGRVAYHFFLPSGKLLLLLQVSQLKNTLHWTCIIRPSRIIIKDHNIHLMRVYNIINIFSQKCSTIRYTYNFNKYESTECIFTKAKHHLQILQWVCPASSV